MKKQCLIAGMTAGFLLIAPFSLTAQRPPDPGPKHHHHDGSSGVRLATDIVNLVRAVVEPRPVVVAPAPPPPAPVVVAPPPPPPAPAVVVTPPASYEYRYYRGTRVIYYSGWYWYSNGWVWGGYGAPPPPPRWRPAPPPHHHYAPPRPAPRPAPGPHRGHYR